MHRLKVILLITYVCCGSAQQLPSSRRFLNVTSNFLATAEKKAEPIQPPGAKGSVTVIFWTSEQGAVISARAIDGTPELQKAAVAALVQWRFRPTSLGSRPVQMGSALLIDFAESPPALQAVKPMTAAQLSPGFQFKCESGVQRQDAHTVDVCKQQLAAVEDDSASTQMDRFTVHDQLGLALMYANKPKEAMKQFAQAIQSAQGTLTASDAEWAYAYWHLAAAESELGNKAEAEKDFSTAEASLQGAKIAIGNAALASYYGALLDSLVKQHAALLVPIQ